MKNKLALALIIFIILVFPFIVPVFGTFLFLSEYNDYQEHNKFVESDTIINIYSAEELDSVFNSAETKRYLVKGLVAKRVVCPVVKDSVSDFVSYYERGTLITYKGDREYYYGRYYFADSLFITENIVLTNLYEHGCSNYSEFKRVETPDSTKIWNGIFDKDSLSFVANVGTKKIQLLTSIRRGCSDNPLNEYYYYDTEDMYFFGIALMVIPWCVVIGSVFILVTLNKQRKRGADITYHSAPPPAPRQFAHSMSPEPAKGKKTKQPVLLILFCGGMLFGTYSNYDTYDKSSGEYEKFNEVVKKLDVNNLPVIKNNAELASAFSSEVKRLYFVDNISCDSVSAIDFEGEKYVYIKCTYFEAHYQHTGGKHSKIIYEPITSKCFAADTMYYSGNIRLSGLKNADFRNCPRNEEVTGVGKRCLDKILPENCMSFLAEIGAGSIRLVDFGDKPIIYFGDKNAMMYELVGHNYEVAENSNFWFWIFLSLFLVSLVAVAIYLKKTISNNPPL